MNVLLVTTDQQKATTIGAYGDPLGATPRARPPRGAAARASPAAGRRIRSASRRGRRILTGQYPSTHGVIRNGIDLPSEAAADSVATHFARRGLRHRVLRQGALRVLLPRLPDRPHRVGAGLRLGAARLVRTVLRLPARRAGDRRAQHPPGAAGGPLELGLRTAADGPALRAPPVPRRPRARLRAAAPDAAGGRGAHVGRHAGVEEPAPEEDHPTTWIADRAIDWLDADRRPFFAWVSFPDPHHPFDPPRPWCDRYDPADMLAVLAARPSRRVRRQARLPPLLDHRLPRHRVGVDQSGLGAVQRAPSSARSWRTTTA